MIFQRFNIGVVVTIKKLTEMKKNTKNICVEISSI